MNKAELARSSMQTKIAERARYARALRREPPAAAQGAELRARIRAGLIENDAVLVAHYYVDGEIQELARETGGHVADSLEMARFGYEHRARTVVVAGVRFMGETAKILSPEKRVVLVESEAECSLDLGCPPDAFSSFCDAHPDRVIVVYANTSAAVKARADWAVTSSIALDVVAHLHAQGRKILWAPDKYLGDYVQRRTGADMLLWDGSCIVHEEFKGVALRALKKQHPDAKVLVHPESPPAVIEQADVVGSTSQLIAATLDLDARKFIVATERGIFHAMKGLAPGKTLLPAPTAGEGASCESCAECPWMKMNSLQGLAHVLETGVSEVLIDEQLRRRAEISIRRMVEFKAADSAAIPAPVAA